MSSSPAALNVLITGINGFVGYGVARLLSGNPHYIVRGSARHTTSNLPDDCSQIIVADLNNKTDWRRALEGIDVIIHAAARVHIMSDDSADPLSEFHRINVDGTLHLANQAASQNVKRFIFISSIKVNGEETPVFPFKPDDTPSPMDAYGVSKMEAEDGLRRLSAQSKMEVVIVRPPLVYGPGVRANFGAMMKWLKRGVPLPLGAIHDNRRSLVALDNLADLLITCIKHPAAANQTFLVSDNDDLSTTELLRRTAIAMNITPRLLPVAPYMLELGAKILGKHHVTQRLCGSLQVDITKTCNLLGWAPPISIDEGLRRAVAGIL